MAIKDIHTRFLWLTELSAGKITRQEAALRFEITPKQVGRLLRRYASEGFPGLIHRLVDKPSNSRYSDTFKENTLNLVRYKYFDCSPTLASELLFEDEGIKVNPETLRLWMRQSNLQIKTRKRKPYRQRRERKEAFGQMLQIDGSFHKWFGGKKSCLLNLIDDATSQNFCYFDHE